MSQTSPYRSLEPDFRFEGFYSLIDPFSQTSQITSKPVIQGRKSPKSAQKSQMNIEQELGIQSPYLSTRTRRPARALTNALARRLSQTIWKQNIPQPLAYSFACRLYDEGAAVLPFKNSDGGMLIVKGHRQAAAEFDAPGNLLDDFHRMYHCEPDGWAVLTGPRGYIVIDCEDSETFRLASLRFPNTRKTFGSKGGHIHLRVAGQIERKQYFKDGRLLFEVLSNWMVTLPGSIHRKTGKPYKLISDAPVQRISLEEFEARVKMLCMELGIEQQSYC